MKKLQKGEIILINFPFSDQEGKKLRPALVVADCSHGKYQDIIILAITSQKLEKKEREVEINDSDLSEGKLPRRSYIRVSKITTIERKMIKNRVALLGSDKISEVVFKLNQILK